MCASDEGEACLEQDCSLGGDNQSLAVRFNSRSYLLTPEASVCEDDKLTDGYSCADYDDGAMVLGGQTLSFDVDLSSVGCGCNAALYLVSMPQNKQPTACGDFYCDANSVCGVACTEIDLMEANKVSREAAGLDETGEQRGGSTEDEDERRGGKEQGGVG